MCVVCMSVNTSGETEGLIHIEDQSEFAKNCGPSVKRKTYTHTQNKTFNCGSSCQVQVSLVAF